jgi:L-ascorbate metabolism protein UlaG (beta-lactamase superfamily)
MKITKLDHSGVIVEKDGKIIVIDPVEYSCEMPELKNVVAIIISHKHGDHFQPEVIARIMSANRGACIYTTEENSKSIEGAIAVAAGDSKEVGGFRLEFFGKDHAAIIPGQIPCENIGVVIDGEVMMPGDSFDMTGAKVKVLGVPIAGPWCKVCESIEYIKNVKPEIVIPIHDAVLSELGKVFNNNWLRNACEEVGARFEALEPSKMIEID